MVIIDDADSLVRPCTDEVSDMLLDLVPYLCHMPPEFASATTGDPDDEDVLHFPSPEFLTFIAENIVVAFLVNLAASDSYRRLLRRGRKLESVDELESIRRKTLKTTNRQKLRISLKRVEIDIMRETETRVEEILYNYGVPGREAAERARDVASHLRAAVEEQTGE